MCAKDNFFKIGWVTTPNTYSQRISTKKTCFLSFLQSRTIYIDIYMQNNEGWWGKKRKKQTTFFLQLMKLEHTTIQNYDFYTSIMNESRDTPSASFHLLLLKKSRPQRCANPSMTWLDGFFCTTNVARVPSSVSTSCRAELLIQAELRALLVFPLLMEPFILDETAVAEGLSVLGTGTAGGSSLELAKMVPSAASGDNPLDSGTGACMPSNDGSFGAISTLDCTSSCGWLGFMSFKDSIIASIIICIQVK